MIKLDVDALLATRPCDVVAHTVYWREAEKRFKPSRLHMPLREWLVLLRRLEERIAENEGLRSQRWAPFKEKYKGQRLIVPGYAISFDLELSWTHLRPERLLELNALEQIQVLADLERRRLSRLCASVYRRSMVLNTTAHICAQTIANSDERHVWAGSGPHKHSHLVLGELLFDLAPPYGNVSYLGLVRQESLEVSDD